MAHRCQDLPMSISGDPGGMHLRLQTELCQATISLELGPERPPSGPLLQPFGPQDAQAGPAASPTPEPHSGSVQAHKAPPRGRGRHRPRPRRTWGLPLDIPVPSLGVQQWLLILLPWG